MARAGKDGKGAILLADYEEGHLTRRELRDMTLELVPVPNTTSSSNVVTRVIRDVEEDAVLANSAEQEYRTWLWYHNGHLQKVR